MSCKRGMIACNTLQSPSVHITVVHMLWMRYLAAKMASALCQVYDLPCQAL